MGVPSLRRPTALRNATDEVVLAVGWAGGWQRRRKSPHRWLGPVRRLLYHVKVFFCESSLLRNHRVP